MFVCINLKSRFILFYINYSTFKENPISVCFLLVLGDFSSPFCISAASCGAEVAAADVAGQQLAYCRWLTVIAAHDISVLSSGYQIYQQICGWKVKHVFRDQKGKKYWNISGFIIRAVLVCEGKIPAAINWHNTPALVCYQRGELFTRATFNECNPTVTPHTHWHTHTHAEGMLGS